MSTTSGLPLDGEPAALPGNRRQATTQLDDEHVRVTRWDFNPGAETGWHRHGWLYVVVPVTQTGRCCWNCRAEQTDDGGP